LYKCGLFCSPSWLAPVVSQVRAGSNLAACLPAVPWETGKSPSGPEERSEKVMVDAAVVVRNGGAAAVYVSNYLPREGNFFGAGPVFS
jgi:hypothetical protein